MVEGDTCYGGLTCAVGEEFELGYEHGCDAVEGGGFFFLDLGRERSRFSVLVLVLDRERQ